MDWPFQYQHAEAFHALAGPGTRSTLRHHALQPRPADRQGSGGLARLLCRGRRTGGQSRGSRHGISARCRGDLPPQPRAAPRRASGKLRLHRHAGTHGRGLGQSQAHLRGLGIAGRVGGKTVPGAHARDQGCSQNSARTVRRHADHATPAAGAAEANRRPGAQDGPLPGHHSRRGSCHSTLHAAGVQDLEIRAAQGDREDPDGDDLPQGQSARPGAGDPGLDRGSTTSPMSCTTWRACSAPAISRV